MKWFWALVFVSAPAGAQCISEYDAKGQIAKSLELVESRLLGLTGKAQPEMAERLIASVWASHLKIDGDRGYRGGWQTVARPYYCAPGSQLFFEFQVSCMGEVAFDASCEN